MKALESFEKLEKLLEKLLDDYAKSKEENEQLWSQLNEALSKLERLEKEKRELELLVESYKNSMNTLIEKLQRLIETTEKGEDHEA